MTLSEELHAALEQAARTFPAQLAEATTPQALEQLRVAFLGRKSELALSLKRFAALTPQERAAVGKQANELKTVFEAQLAAKRESLATPQLARVVDVTLPGRDIPQGRLHPITQMMDEILSIFTPMGFEVVEGPEMELEFYNFDALNIPRDHPSRESFDTFFVDLPPHEPRHGRPLLRSHTSPMQVRVMEQRQPPLAILVPGKVYRPDPLDSSHSFMFHQVEGLRVDDHTSFADLKEVLERFVQACFGGSRRVRFRPHFFPFTEPSAEVDISCGACGGRGCSTCGQKGWLEIMGCGMVHPHVLKTVGYDSRQVQGYAFGLGVERIAMLKYGVSDIRLFFDNDLRFLGSG